MIMQTNAFLLFLRYAIPCISKRSDLGWNTRNRLWKIYQVGNPTEDDMDFVFTCFRRGYESFLLYAQEICFDPMVFETVAKYWRSAHTHPISPVYTLTLEDCRQPRQGDTDIWSARNGDGQTLWTFNAFHLALEPGQIIYIHHQTIIEPTLE